MCYASSPRLARGLVTDPGLRKPCKNAGNYSASLPFPVFDLFNDALQQKDRTTRQDMEKAHTAQASLMDMLMSDPSQFALFFDIDGTLIDLAPTPDAIYVPPGLADALSALSRQVQGALALVTGRSLSYADQLFAPHHFAIAGLHGTERRQVDGSIIKTEPTAAFLAVKAELAALESRLPGVLVEDKGGAIAVHYRQNPDAGSMVENVMREAQALAGTGYALQRGKMVFEIRPDSADKGKAMAAYMAAPPFAGRIPVAVGDDLTDEAMFQQANACGGLSIRVGLSADQTHAQQRLSDPQAVRDLITSLRRTQTHH